MRSCGDRVFRREHVNNFYTCGDGEVGLVKNTASPKTESPVVALPIPGPLASPNGLVCYPVKGNQLS